MEDEDILNVRDCFRYDPSSRSAICRVSKNGVLCRQKISNNHHGNKLRHLKLAHHHIHAKIIKTKKKKKKIYSTSGRVQIELNISDVYAAFVELVTKNGRPFSVCDDSGMRILLNPILDAIHKATGERYTINHLVIKEKVCAAYEYVRKHIIAEIENKPISIMIDIATRHNHSILGINIRYIINESTIAIRNIGMVSLTKSHTAENLAQVVRDAFKEYEIKPKQVFASTSDNAWNAVNVSGFLNDDCGENMNESYDFNDKVFELLNDSYYGKLLDSVKPILQTEYPHVLSIACGAHTLQLATNDSLKSPLVATDIHFVKEIVKHLRTPTIANILRQKKMKQAVIDHEIRWNYTYLMVFITLYSIIYWFIDSLNAFHSSNGLLN